MSSNFQTAEQAKAEHILRMGKDLGTIYDALWHQIAWVHAKWSEYVVLFGIKASRVDLLNKAAPSFCRLIEGSLWENVLLHVARLTNPPSTGKKENLTVQLFSNLINEASTRAKVDSLVESALSASEFARDWRNRHIAHVDLDLSVSDTAKALELASRQRVNDALRALAEVVNAVSSHYLDSPKGHWNRTPGNVIDTAWESVDEWRPIGRNLGHFLLNDISRCEHKDFT